MQPEVGDDAGAASSSVTRKRATKGSDAHVSNALRTAYQATVQEDVPDEFLDLLGKLA